ncbi:MAG TPA: alpha-L-fucosidase [Pyrinomonadaceae bacterium]|nr:alpha-L-fucosidase [Pyrinomonadaceae bacterium]
MLHSKALRCVLVCAALFGSAHDYVARAQTADRAEAERDRRLKWFREARFGLFIHWGLYAVPAGEWKGKLVPGIGEWIMNRARIPVAEYEQLTKQFNPVEFDADAWVRLARDAGMKYLVITSKHHDGFAMYRSKASPYNIADATPFRRDPLKELSEACRKYGVRLGFYYSQTQDWHERDAAGNDWDWPADRKRDFQRYLDEKVKPQVTELLTGYSPVALIWFDTPRDITREQSRELVELVHKLQPDCLVSGRVGHGLGDYDSAGDNQISVGKVRRDWETPVTMNDTWGFKRDDQNWKPTGVLIRQLVQVSSRGGNYLLNVGPTAEGRIPAQSVERLTQVGRWLKANSESVYGARPSPFPYEQPWGIITTKPGRVYLHVFQWPRGELVLYGLKSKVRRAYLLSNKAALKFTQRSDAALGHEALALKLPASAPDAYNSVIALEVEGEPEVDTMLTQQPGGTVTLPAHLAEVHRAAAGGEGLRFDTRGVAERWTNKDEWLNWDFRVVRPGEYDVVVVTSEQKYGRDWEGGHEVLIESAGQTLRGKVGRDGKEVDPANPYWPYVVSRLGRLRVDRPGRAGLSLKPQTLVSDKKLGLTLVNVRLVPAGQ